MSMIKICEMLEHHAPRAQFVRAFAIRHSDQHISPTNSAHLTQECGMIVDVLQHFKKDGSVERPIIEWQTLSGNHSIHALRTSDPHILRINVGRPDRSTRLRKRLRVATSCATNVQDFTTSMP